METLKLIEGKIFDGRADWQAIDKEKALKDTRILDLLREACLVEGYFGVYTGKMMQLFWNDVGATSIFTIESFEAYGHYYMLKRYLDAVGYRPVTEEEIVALRAKDEGKVYDDPIKELVNFMGTEHFAAEFFRDIMGLTEEPVLKGLLPRFVSEEVTHSQFAFDLLKARMDKDPAVKDAIITHAKNYQHVGSYVLPWVSPAKEDNLKIIQSFNEKVEKLVGESLSDIRVENLDI
jgi:hypothetical protein